MGIEPSTLRAPLDVANARIASLERTLETALEKLAAWKAWADEVETDFRWFYPERTLRQRPDKQESV